MPSVDARDVAEAMLAHPSPVVTAGDLADDLDCTSRHVLTLLRGLEAVGVVESRETGAHAVAWWHTERVRPPNPDAHPGDEAASHPDAPDDRRGVAGNGDEETAPAPGADDGEREQEQERDGSAAANAPDDEVRAAVDRAAEWWDDDDRLADRREAALAVLNAVRESDHGLTKTEIVERFADEYPVPGQSEGTWWRRNLAEGAESDDAPAPLRLVATYSRGTHKWRWVGLDDTDTDDGEE